MKISKRVSGLVLISMGTGILMVLVIPGWGFILAAMLVMIGFKYLFI